MRTRSPALGADDRRRALAHARLRRARRRRAVRVRSGQPDRARHPRPGRSGNRWPVVCARGGRRRSRSRLAVRRSRRARRFLDTGLGRRRDPAHARAATPRPSPLPARAPGCCRIGVVMLRARGIRDPTDADLRRARARRGRALDGGSRTGRRRSAAAARRVRATQHRVSRASAISFSVGMQAGVALVNTLVGLTALMLMFRTLTPGGAVRRARAAAGDRARGPTGGGASAPPRPG